MEATRFIRRVLDTVVAALTLFLAAPLLLLIAAMIRLDSGGPAIFRQRRIGLDEAEFTVNKFRTMYSEQIPPRIANT